MLNKITNVGNNCTDFLKTIVLVEIFWVGHHPTYTKLFSKFILKQGYRLIVLCPSPNEVYEYLKTHVPEYIHNLVIDSINDINLSSKISIPGLGALLPTILRWYRLTSKIKKITKRIAVTPNVVIINYLDRYLHSSYSPSLSKIVYQLVEMIFPYKWIGLLIITDWFSINKSTYNLVRSKKCKSILVLNEHNANKFREFQDIYRKVSILPDITDDEISDISYDVAELVRERANGRCVIGLLGFLSKRKGLVSLIKIAKQCQEKPYFFLFAGFLDRDSFTPEESELIDEFSQSNPSNCLLKFERIPEESQFNSLVMQCDILYAVYDNFPNSSNILTKAAVFQKFAMVAKGFSMEDFVDQFKMGISVDFNNLDEQINSLEILVDKERFLKNIGVPKFEEFKSAHSIDNFSKKLIDILSDIK